MRKLPSQKTLSEIITLNCATGSMFWQERDPKWFIGNARFTPEAAARMWNGRNAGKAAFARKAASGYLVGCLFGDLHLAHRVIWKMVHGVDAQTIDHINGDKSDNRLTNIRSVNQAQNAANKPLYKNNSTGKPGVTRTSAGLWKVQIGFRGRTYYRGCFLEYGDAVKARENAEIEFGYHQNHGRTDKERTNRESGKQSGKL